MTKYAAYDENAIYAIGDTREQALDNAYSFFNHPDFTGLSVREIEPDFAADILENGFNPDDSFQIENGVILRWED